MEALNRNTDEKITASLNLAIITREAYGKKKSP